MSTDEGELRVLVVEDDPVSRTVIQRVLVERGHQVETVESAERALELHAAAPFHLLIVDWFLAGEMDGIQLCRALRGDPANQDVGILMVTGRSESDDLDTILQAGATDFLAKPFSLPTLTTRIAVASKNASLRMQRRTAMQAEAQAQARFAAITNAVPDAVIYANHKGQIRLVNPAFSDLFGWTEREAIGMDRARLFVDRDGFPTKDGETLETRMQRADGTTFIGEVVCVVVQGDEGFSQLGLVRDVTERRQIQARLQVADRMVSMGTLAAGVAHEINNPMTFIIGNLNFLAQELEVLHQDDPKNPEIAEMRQTIDEALVGSDRVRSIVKELKTFARGDDETVGHVDVTEVMESTLVMAMNSIRHKGTLVKSYEPVGPVLANSSRLSQVFLNILVNAAEALPAGRTENQIRIWIRMDGDFVAVDVRDNGPGITEEQLQRIWDPFFTTKPIGEGTGLGLAICHGIVAHLGGEIRATSQQGGPTTFTVALPAATSLLNAP